MTHSADQLYEQLLLVRFAAGDDRAFAEIVHRYHRRLRYYVRRLVGRPDLADDVLQEVWVAAFRKIGRLEHGAALSVWLYRTARNQALAQLRRVARDTAARDVRSREETGAEAPTFSAEDAERVHRGLERLPTALREVLVLRFLEEMTYDGIACVIGCPLGTVRSRVHNAKLALRRVLERKR